MRLVAGEFEYEAEKSDLKDLRKYNTVAAAIRNEQRVRIKRLTVNGDANVGSGD